MDANDNSFWRTNSRAVPGRPSPKRLEANNRAGGASANGANSASLAAGGAASSFQDFQKSCSDAWDMGDDEFCILSSGLNEGKISKRASQSAALNVLKIHRNNNAAGRQINGPSNSQPVSPAPVQQPPSIAAHPKPNAPPTKPPINADRDEETVSHPQPSSSGDARPSFRPFHFPGRPQLIRLSSNSLCRGSDHESKVEKFRALLDAPLLNQLALNELSFSGVPGRCRAITWRLLSGYLPTSHERRGSVLERKRLDYQNLLDQYFHCRDSNDETQQDTFHQIHIDVPRMNPQVQLFQQPLVQEMFERVLFIWAIRHPASGYVQGINDLVTPFFIVFLQEALRDEETSLDTFMFADLTLDQRNIIEADSFWCLSKFMDCIQDNYIFAQLGIQAKVNQLKELIQRIDAPLHRHLQQHDVDYLQFSFRWMNNLLTRELPLHCTIRLWDTYLAESDGFAVFQLYVCAAFLLHWREQLLQEQDFQGLLLLLQNLPTHNWSDSHISILVAEAYRLKFTYADAPKHLEGKS